MLNCEWLSTLLSITIVYLFVFLPQCSGVSDYNVLFVCSSLLEDDYSEYCAETRCTYVHTAY